MAQPLGNNQSHARAVDWIINLLQQADLQVLPSFSLRAALPANMPFTCPDHEHTCDSELAVLLVYAGDHRPVTVLAHGHNGHTWLTFADTQGEQPSPHLMHKIRAALALATPTTVNGEAPGIYGRSLKLAPIGPPGVKH